jgi:hypothetical protein
MTIPIDFPVASFNSAFAVSANCAMATVEHATSMNASFFI